MKRMCCLQKSKRSNRSCDKVDKKSYNVYI